MIVLTPKILKQDTPLNHIACGGVFSYTDENRQVFGIKIKETPEGLSELIIRNDDTSWAPARYPSKLLVHFHTAATLSPTP